jgi:hypothetical protein
MVFQTNGSGIFQKDHSYMWHIYLITALGCSTFQSLGKKQFLTIYARLAICLQQASSSKKLYWKYESKGTLKKKACLMQDILVSETVTARRFNVWGLQNTLP